MPNVKLQNGNVLLQGNKVSCACCFTCENPTKAPDYYWYDGGYHSKSGEHCEYVYINENSFINPLDTEATLYICGYVDDVIKVNGIEEDYGCCPGPCCSDPNVNGAHNVSIKVSTTIGIGESTVISYYDTCAEWWGGLAYIDISLYYIAK